MSSCIDANAGGYGSGYSGQALNAGQGSYQQNAPAGNSNAGHGSYQQGAAAGSTARQAADSDGHAPGLRSQTSGVSSQQQKDDWIRCTIIANICLSCGVNVKAMHIAVSIVVSCACICCSMLLRLAACCPTTCFLHAIRQLTFSHSVGCFNLESNCQMLDNFWLKENIASQQFSEGHCSGSMSW